MPGLEINERASAAACTAEVLAADEACRLAGEGLPFRDAYAQVAQQLARGEFKPETSSARAPAVELDALADELTQSANWIAGRRRFLAATSETLFDWK